MTTLSSPAVSAIQNGTVIDHIDAGYGLKIVQLLKIATHKKQVTIGLNLPSSKLDLKDIIKIEDRELSPEEANQVAILAPDATINIINNFEVNNKFKVTLPNTIEAVIPCPNPRCISNHDKIPSSLKVLRRIRKNTRLQCHYCRELFTQQEIR